MIYPRMRNVDGGNPSVDTDSPEYKNRINWVCDMAGLPQPELIPFLNVGPLVAGGNVASGSSLTPHAALKFTNPKNGGTTLITIEAIDDGDDTNPVEMLQGTLAYLSLELGLGLSPQAIQNMIYRPPAPAKALEDWEQPYSAIGPPIEGQPGFFRSLHRGNKENDTWTGKSGATYRFVYIGSFAFFRYLAWHKE